jgi:hypothetical protein
MGKGMPAGGAAGSCVLGSSRPVPAGAPLEATAPAAPSGAAPAVARFSPAAVLPCCADSPWVLVGCCIAKGDTPGGTLWGACAALGPAPAAAAAAVACALAGAVPAAARASLAAEVTAAAGMLALGGPLGMLAAASPDPVCAGPKPVWGLSMSGGREVGPSRPICRPALAATRALLRWMPSPPPSVPPPACAASKPGGRPASPCGPVSRPLPAAPKGKAARPAGMGMLLPGRLPAVVGNMWLYSAAVAVLVAGNSGAPVVAVLVAGALPGSMGAEPRGGYRRAAAGRVPGGPMMGRAAAAPACCCCCCCAVARACCAARKPCPGSW